jgi:hypothetical protein
MKHGVTDPRVQDGTLNRVQLEPQILKKLTQEVKETVAKDIRLPRAVRNFSVVDLWNLRRNRRYKAHTRKQPTIHTGLRG